MDQRLDGVAIIVGDDRQRAQGFGLETIDRALAGFAMQALVGDFCRATAAPGGSHRADR